MSEVSGYYETNYMLKHFNISRSTLDRWMKRKENPLPRPRIKASGTSNKWAKEDINKWEAKEC